MNEALDVLEGSCGKEEAGLELLVQRKMSSARRREGSSSSWHEGEIRLEEDRSLHGMAQRKRSQHIRALASEGLLELRNGMWNLSGMRNESSTIRPTCGGIFAARLLENLWARKRQQVFKREERVHLSKRAANIPPKTAVRRRAPRHEVCVRAGALVR